MFIQSKEDFLKKCPCNPYQLLARMKADCEYVIAIGPTPATYKHLWALHPLKQIVYMRYLFESLEEKPEWISEKMIEKYAKEMGVYE